MAAWRGETIENLGLGMVAACDARGVLLASAGDCDRPVFLRSAGKPIQALPLVLSGAAEAFGFGDAEIALACGSHAGSARHLEVLARMLAKAGLREEHLRCGIHPPVDPGERERLRTAGEAPSRRHGNCSGKHAGFLATARHGGYDLESYLDPGHPVQRGVLEALAALAGMDQAAIALATDGCGAPTFALPLRAVARSFAAFADPPSAPSGLAPGLTRIGRAMAAEPWCVGGDGHFETELMRATHGRIIIKPGAEGVLALAAGGIGLAIKLEAGVSGEPLHAVTVDALEQLELLGGSELEAVARWRRPSIRNLAGTVTGRLEPLLRLRP